MFPYIGWVVSFLTGLGFAGLAVWIHYFTSPGKDVTPLGATATLFFIISFIIMLAIISENKHK